MKSGARVEPSRSVDGSRKEATVTFTGARGWRLGTGDATAAVGRTLDRLAVACVVDGVGAAAVASAASTADSCQSRSNRG